MDEKVKDVTVPLLTDLVMDATLQFTQIHLWPHSWSDSRPHRDTAEPSVCHSCRIGATGV